MNSNLTHVYLMPGMAANPTIFEYIKLPETQYKIHWLEWQIQLVGHIDLLAKYTFGETLKKRVELYKKYLSVSDKTYLDWAIKQVICWDQTEPNANAIYIHGDKDIVFPHSCVGDCIVLKGGTHIMVINKYKWFNENLPKLIQH